METTTRPPAWKTLLAFAIIYFVWGSTFLAIRVGVREVPPFLLAGMRFFSAGIILYAWRRLKGDASPTLREWRAATLLAVLIFVFDYGLLFWAERRVPSGVAAVMMATIPVFMTLAEIGFLGTQRLSMRLAVALVVGLGGVAVLVSHSAGLGAGAIDAAGAVALVFGAISWSVASVLTRRMTLPASKSMSSAAQMLAGGILLTLTAGGLGEFKGFHPQAVSRNAWLALVYLIVAGSIVAFTAYVWLIHHESPTKVGTYAYVNPVVAVALGYLFGGEAVGPRTLLGTLLVLVSVVVITTTPKRKVDVRSNMKSMIEFGFPEEWRNFERRQSEFINRFPRLQEAIVMAFPTVELSEPADRVIYFLVRTCAEDFQEILLLCGNGYGIAAEKLLRGMYERAVTASHLHRCPEEAQNFLDYEKVSQHKLLKAVEESISNDVFNPEQKERIEEDFKRIKEKFMIESCKTCKSQRLNHSWSSLDVVSMARASGDLWKLLVPAYYMGLREGHSTTGSIFSRLDATAAAADQGLIFAGESQPKRADSALSIAHHILLITLGVQRDHFKIDPMGKALDMCMEDLLEILKSQRAADKTPTP